MSTEAQADQTAFFCSLSVHSEDFPEGNVVYDPETIKLKQGRLYRLAPQISSSSIQDFQKSSSTNTLQSSKGNDARKSSIRKRLGAGKKPAKTESSIESHVDLSKSMFFVAQPLYPNPEQRRNLRGMQVSLL